MSECKQHSQQHKHTLECWTCSVLAAHVSCSLTFVCFQYRCWAVPAGSAGSYKLLRFKFVMLVGAKSIQASCARSQFQGKRETVPLISDVAVHNSFGLFTDLLANILNEWFLCYKPHIHTLRTHFLLVTHTPFHGCISNTNMLLKDTLTRGLD